MAEALLPKLGPPSRPPRGGTWQQGGTKSGDDTRKRSDEDEEEEEQEWEDEEEDRKKRKKGGRGEDVPRNQASSYNVHPARHDTHPNLRNHCNTSAAAPTSADTTTTRHNH
eukprot:274242-Pyramimonas_sp.AAC.1